jgi:hypothetical protein
MAGLTANMLTKLAPPSARLLAVRRAISRMTGLFTEMLPAREGLSAFPAAVNISDVAADVVEFHVAACADLRYQR